MERSQIQATVDFDKPGKQHGHIRVPYSYDLGGWANLLMPVTVLGKQTESTLHGQINGGGPKLTLRSSGGDIRVRKM